MPLLSSQMTIKTVFAFDHIPKCAGTSMHTLLASNIQGYRPVRNAGELLTCAAGILGDGTDTHYIGGHYVYGIHELLPAGWRVKYFTLLRKPLEVAYSYYKYRRRIGLTPYGSFLDFMYDTPGDIITRFLGNSYEMAVARLERYSFIGFLDRPEDAIASISVLLGRALPPLPLHNVTIRHQTLLDEMDFTALPQDMLDVRLYDHFRQMADARAGAAALTGTHAPVKCPPAKGATSRTNGTATVHYTPRNEAVEIWGLNKYDSSHVKELLMQKNDVNEIVSLAKILACSNAAIDDACFKKIVDTNSQELLTLYINVSQINTENRYYIFYNMADRLLHEIRFDMHSTIFFAARAVVIYLALSRYAKEKNLSEMLLRELLTLSPRDENTLRALAVQLRIKGDYAGAMAALVSIPQGNKTTIYCNEYLITKALHDGRAVSSTELMTDDVFTPHRTARNLLENNFTLSKRKRLSSLAGKDVLIMRSGPLPVLDDLLRALDQENCAVSIVLQQSLRQRIGDQNYTRYIVDDGWFEPDANAELKASLRTKSYNAVILLCSDFESLNRLHNFIEFCQDIPHSALYAYPISNLFAGQSKKSIIPLDSVPPGNTGGLPL